jgi:deoxyribodipyrimidine photo-lyase
LVHFALQALELTWITELHGTKFGKIDIALWLVPHCCFQYQNPVLKPRFAKIVQSKANTFRFLLFLSSMQDLKADINLVWFKRDLRLQDHAPLRAAFDTDLPTLLLYCFEPSWMNSPDSDWRHWRFVWQSLQEMQAQLKNKGTCLAIFHAEVLEVLEKLAEAYQIHRIFSHVETGNRITFDRDLAVAAYCQNQGIEWQEFQTNGVKRRLYHRKGWEQQFIAHMSEPLARTDWAKFQGVILDQKWEQRFGLERILPELEAQNPLMQPGGEGPAQRYLASFLNERSKTYFKHISKPEAARRSCSRLSPYLTWGNLSTRQVFQAAQARIQNGGDRYNLQQFSSRLFWQSHFIQKFEAECRMEFENLNRGFDAIRQKSDPILLKAWAEGQTGIPLVDACMRCVCATGYLNFRMRSMLVSFLTHQLWQPWQSGVHHLARQFLDYEPGIHYSQFQMQAGTMGVNTIRIYNPVKQAQEHDPQAEFIKKWVPELANLPITFAHEPWKMTPLDQAFHGFELGKDYPLPIVDLEKNHAYAREQLWAMRKSASVRQENQRILKVHTKRKNADESSVMGDAKTQDKLMGSEKLKG